MTTSSWDDLLRDALARVASADRAAFLRGVWPEPELKPAHEPLAVEMVPNVRRDRAATVTYPSGSCGEYLPDAE